MTIYRFLPRWRHCVLALAFGAATVGTSAAAGTADEEASAFGSFLAGRFAEQESDARGAAAFMARVLEERPEDEALLRRTFQLTFAAGDIGAAKALARRIEDAGGRDSQALLLLAVDEMERGAYEAALHRLAAMPQSGIAVYALPIATAWAHVGLGEYDRALDALSSLEKHEGFAGLFNLHAALVNDVADRPEAAASRYEAVASDLATAPLRVMLAAGSLYERSGRPEAARSLYERFLETQPDSIVMARALARLDGKEAAKRLVATPLEGLAEGLFNLASALPRDRAGTIAMGFGRLALHLRPEFDLARLLVGDILDSQGRYADANAIYQSLPAASPYAWTARLRVADNLAQAGEPEEAIALLRRMAEERADRIDALMKLGGVLRVQERYAEAVDVYDLAVQRLGEVRPVDWPLLYNLGIALERTKQWDRAEEAFLKALEFEPDQPYVLNYLGYSWVEQGVHLERAREMIERAVAQRQNDGYIVDSLGWVLYKMGDYAGAVEQLERAVRLRPQDPVINDHLGDAYWKVGRRHEARFQWRRALSFEPESDVVQSIKTKLERGLQEAKAGGSGG